MKHFYKIYVLGLLFICPAYTQVSLSFSAGPDFYEQELAFDPSTGFNIGVSYILQPGRSVGLEYHQNVLQQQILTPVGRELRPTLVNSLKVNFKNLIIRNFYSLMIQPQVSFGVVTFQRNAYAVQLGALGEKDIPALSKQYFTSSLALNILKNIYKQTSLFIRPEISMYDFKNYKKVFSIAGGIDVRLF